MRTKTGVFDSVTNLVITSSVSTSLGCRVRISLSISWLSVSGAIASGWPSIRERAIGSGSKNSVAFFVKYARRFLSGGLSAFRKDCLRITKVSLQYGAQLQMLDEGIESLWVGVAEGVMCAGTFLGSARMVRAKRPKNAFAPVAVVACTLVAVSAVWMGASSCASMVLGLAAISFCFPAASIAVVSKVYLSASDAMQGRARSLVVFVTQMLSALAMALAGQLLDTFGIVSVSLAAACAAAAAFMVCVRAVRAHAGSTAR